MNRMYQLYELRDELPNGIEKAKQLYELEEELIDIVNKSGKAEKFEFMLKDFKNEMEGLKGQIDRMEFRLPILNELIADYEKRDENSKIIADTVSKVLESIGAAVDPEKVETNEPLS